MADKTANVRIVLKKVENNKIERGLCFVEPLKDGESGLSPNTYAATIQQFVVSDDGTKQDWVDVDIVIEE